MSDVIAQQRFPCPNCGAELTWSPAQKTFVCASCGTTLRPEPLETTHSKILEQDTGQLPRGEARAKPQHRAAFRCTGCHAVSYFDRAATRCPFCGAAALAPYDAFDDFFRPDTLVPFLTSESEAREAALQWIRSVWFAPSKLARLARSGAIKGAYYPFWTFEAHAIAHWDRPGGVRGIVEMDFDDLLVCAARDMDTRLAGQLAPFPAKGFRAYDPRYTAGWVVASAQRDQDDAMHIAHGLMESELLAAAKHGQPPKEREKMQLRGVEYAREICRQTLLPVWALDYAYLQRRHRILVNGATGKTAGSAPISIAKLALIAIVAFGFGLSIMDPDAALQIARVVADALRSLVP
jgi:hypothetical protein